MNTFVLICVLVSVLSYIPHSLQKNTPGIVLDLDEIYSRSVEGSHITFHCDVVPWDIEGIRTEFFYNDTKIETDNEAGILIWGNSLHLQNIKLSTAGKYQCIVNTVNSTHRSNLFYLSVGAKPNITEELPDFIDLRLDQGSTITNRPNDIVQFDDVTLICDVQPKTPGTILLKRRWFRDGKELKSNATAGINITYSILKLPHIERKSEGIYACRVEKDGVILYSDPLIIHVRDKLYAPSEFDQFEEVITATIQLGDKLQADNIREFDNVYFSCIVNPSTTNIRRIIWFHNGTNVSPIDQPGIIHHNISTLILERIEKSSAGRYTCYVETDKGVLFGNPPLVIEVKDRDPIFSLKNKGQPTAEVKLGDRFTPENINELDNVHFTCEIKPSTLKIRRISWFYYGKELYPSPKVDILYDYTLVLPCIKKSFVGRFSCLAETDNGTVIRSSPLIIDVKDITTNADSTTCNTERLTLIPELLHNPDFIYMNDEVRFYCNIYPKTPAKNMKITWFRDGKKLIPYVEIFILYVKQTDNFISQDNQTLIIRQVGKKDIGNYTCEVKIDRDTFKSIPRPLPKVKDRLEETLAPSKNTGHLRPTVIAELLDASYPFYENDDISFYCDVDPKTTPVNKVIWYRNGQKLNRINDDRIKFNKRTLTIRVDKYSAGNFSCQIDTDSETLKSKPTPLKKIKKGKAYRLPWAMGNAYLFVDLGNTSEFDNIHEKDDIHLTCTIRPESTTYFELKWFHDDWPVVEDAKAGVFYTDENRTLNIYRLQNTASGVYTCQADTKKGYLFSSPLYLDVKPPRDESR